MLALAPGLRAQMGGGLNAAVVTSQIDGDTWGGFNKWGYSFGGHARYQFGGPWSLQVEVLYARRGSREVQNDYGQISLQYIDVPVLLQYQLPDNLSAIGIEAGVSGNVLLVARTGFKPLVLDQTDSYRRFSAEGHLGGSLRLAESLSAFGRWSIGLTNLNNTPARRPWLTIHYLSAGLRIHLG